MAAKVSTPADASNDFSVGSVYCMVTGASQGIGRALAVEASKLFGPNSVMLLLARNEKELANTANMCESENVKVMYKPFDLSTASSEKMQDVIMQSIQGRKVTDFDVVLVFHNVGSLGNLSVETDKMENVQELESYFDLNVFNVIALNSQFLKVFQEVEDRIIIINITSLCAIKPMSGMAYYCSGKAAREMYFRVLAEEKKHIKVLNYSPGPVETSMIDYVLEEAVNDNLKQVFTAFKSQGTLLTPDVTAKKCLRILQKGVYTSGDHVDYFDDE
ncbi:sepiapterin reductase [Plutella xylostella]|uniref:sepiapterin reductase n=1 Tax=Plutella xylostella TaxID=51655 RepID=UPI0018D0E6AE|nr:sepiapterin reductase [Plutella xylostella]